MNAKPSIDPTGGSLSHSWPITAAKVFVAVTLGILLYVAHAAFIPVALALLFGVVLSGPVEALHQRRVPRSLSATVILVLVLATIAGIVSLMWTPTQEWFAKAPQTMALVKQKVKPISKFMTHLDDLRKNAANVAVQGHAGPAAPTAAVVVGESAPALILDATAPMIAGLLTFVILTLFLLTGGPPMLARMTAAFVDNLKASYVLGIIEKMRAELGFFYLTTTLINVGLGLATSFAMLAWGMPTPFLWGALAAVLNYIPYAGATVTLLFLTLVALVSFDTLGHVLGVSATYVALATLEGQVVQPLLVGRRLEVNPLLIFLGLWFGGLFWGIPGILLATPALVALKVIAENAKTGQQMMEFLGPNDQTPERDAKLRKLTRRLEDRGRTVKS